MLLIGIVPVILVGILAYFSGKKALRHTIGANFQEMARETADKVQFLMEDEIEEAHKLAISPLVRESILKARHASRRQDGAGGFHLLQSYLREYRLQKPEVDEFVSILIVDKKGNVVDSAGSKETYVGGEKWLQRTLEGR